MAYQQQQQTKAVTVAGKAQQALDEAQIDHRLLMAAKAIQLMAGQDNDGNPKITGDMAIAAAMYQAGTGQLLGRDFYVNEKVGRMEGYRGVARDANERGVGEVQIKYRPLTAQEAEWHEVQPGDTAVVCEVYQLRAWNMAQRMGQRYEPIIGIGVIRKVEKYDKKTTQRWDDGQRRYVQQPESNWRQATLEGGMTWHKKAQNRAYKDALRHTPGMSASPDEVIADAAMNLDELPPETARLTMEQAQAWVEQHGISGDGEPDGIMEGEYVEQPKPQPQPAIVRQGKKRIPDGDIVTPTGRVFIAAEDRADDPPGFEVWADWTQPSHAIAWGMAQGVFDHQRHAEKAYAKAKAASNPANAKEMWAAWYLDVQRRIAERDAGSNDKPAADPDGWEDEDEQSVEMPLFS